MKQQTVVVLGASKNRAKFGNKAVRAFVQQGFEVHPAHPLEVEIEGLPTVPKITDVPFRPDIVSVYLPPPVLLNTLAEIAAKGCGELWLNPGTDTEEVIAEATRLSLKVVRDCSLLRIGVSPAAY